MVAIVQDAFMSKSTVFAGIVVVAASVPVLTAMSGEEPGAPPTTASRDVMSAWFSGAVGRILDGVPPTRDARSTEGTRP